MPLPSDYEIARKVRRGVGGFMLVGGMFQLLAGFGRGAIGSLVLGGLLAATGLGVFRKWSWARWMAQGACYLALFGAFTLPLIMVELRPFADLESEARTSVLFCAFGAAFGFLAYRGLKYFRSELARQEYAADPQSTMAPESSSAVVYSALVWLGALGLYLGMRGDVESLLRQAEPPPRRVESRRVAEPESPRVERQRRPRPLSQLPPGAKPDLEPISLCLTRGGAVQVIIRNNEEARFKVEYSVSYQVWRDAGDRNSRSSPFPRSSGFELEGVSQARVPAGWSRGVVTLHDIPAEPREDGYANVTIQVDSKDSINESNEGNNTKAFPIAFAEGRAFNPDPCPILHANQGLTVLDVTQ